MGGDVVLVLHPRPAQPGHRAAQALTRQHRALAQTLPGHVRSCEVTLGHVRSHIDPRLARCYLMAALMLAAQSPASPGDSARNTQDVFWSGENISKHLNKNICKTTQKIFVINPPGGLVSCDALFGQQTEMQGDAPGVCSRRGWRGAAGVCGGRVTEVSLCRAGPGTWH